jgi:ribosome-binding factor A
VVSKARAIRISDRIREDLSELLLKEVHDPRLTGVSITDVVVDRELAYANVYVSAIEGEQRSKEILEALEHAQGFFRTELAHNSNLRVFPRLRFHWDSTIERAERIEQIIASLHNEDQSQHSSESSATVQEIDTDE